MSSADIGVDLGKYKLGWSDKEDYVYKPTKGLDEKLIQEISWMKSEPEWMRDFRLKSHQRFLDLPMLWWFVDRT